MPKTRKCPECKGIVKEGQTQLSYELEGINIIVKNIPANICEKCRQAFITGHVAEEVNRLVNRLSEDINSFAKTQPQIGKRQREVAIAI
ncbi:MAG: YgiT-type zinc finger protein [Desulfobacterales bacterium]|nr:YgiT-type zinc finger protein [Desulfobacterales bacterium]